METLLITFGFFIAVILQCRLVYRKRKNNQRQLWWNYRIRDEKMCDCEEPCDNLKAKMADGTADPEEVARFSKEPQFYEVK
ncbi:Uncharacterised protein [Actinobacillus equuli]|nr:Uncharacterised protein [Actinobacillus equuli]